MPDQLSARQYDGPRPIGSACPDLCLGDQLGGWKEFLPTTITHGIRFASAKDVRRESGGCIYELLGS